MIKLAVSIVSNKMVIAKRGQVLFIPLDEIYYIERLNQCSLIKCKEDEVSVRVPLKKLEELLPSNFLRGHRSFIINKSSLKELVKQDENNYEAIFCDKKENALVSKEYFNNFLL